MDTRAGQRAIVVVVFFALFLYGFFLSARACLLQDISTDFSVSYTGSGMIFLISLLSMLVTNLISGKVMASLGMKVLYAVSLLFISLSILMQALSYSYLLFLLGTLAHNFFAGGQNMGGNSLVGRAFYGDGGKRMIRLHVCYAVGALAAPLFIGQFSSEAVFLPGAGLALSAIITPASHVSWRVIFLVLSGLFFITLFYFPFYSIKEPFTRYKISFASLRRSLRNPLLVWLSLSVMAAVGFEIGISSWLVYTLEKGYQFTIGKAAFYLSFFFIALGTGRIIGSFLAGKTILERAMTPIAFVQFLVGLFGVLLLPDSAFLLALSGATASIIFPTLYYKLSHYFNENYAESSVIFLIGTGLGASLFPFLVGVVDDLFSVRMGLYVPVGCALFFMLANYKTRCLEQNR